jgi:electron transport complex protein RnfG
MNQIVKNALILMAITLTAGLALGFVYDITKNPIAVQNQKKKEEAYQAVFETAVSFEAAPSFDEKEAEMILEAADLSAEHIDEVLFAKDQNGEELGVVMNVTTSEGYGGDIQFSLGIQKDGTVNGIKILSISETAGLGMKASEEAFYGQFSGKKTDAFQYTKNGAQSDSEIDAISGATITTNAMTNGVNAGLVYFKSMIEGGVISE